MYRLPKPGVIQELLAEAGLGNKGNSKSYILDCPRCRKKDKVYLRKTDGRFICWVCKEIDNFQGSPEYLFAELLNRPIQELRNKIWGLDGPSGNLFLTIELTDFFGEDDEIVVGPAPLPFVEPDPDWRDLDSQWGEPGAIYLASRGIPIEIAKEYGIQYQPNAKRVIFPVVSRGKLVGWQSRYIGPTEGLDEEGNITKVIKALTYSGLKKDRVFMFGDRIAGSHALLCEGPIDALKGHLVGGNVASLGKAVSKTQLELLVSSGISKLYVGLDPDAAPEVKRIVDKLFGDIELYDMRPPSGDLGDMSFEAVYDLQQRAPRINPGHIFIYLKEHTWN